MSRDPGSRRAIAVEHVVDLVAGLAPAVRSREQRLSRLRRERAEARAPVGLRHGEEGSRWARMTWLNGHPTQAGAELRRLQAAYTRHHPARRGPGGG